MGRTAWCEWVEWLSLTRRGCDDDCHGVHVELGDDGRGVVIQLSCELHAWLPVSINIGYPVVDSPNQYQYSLWDEIA